MPPPKTKRLWRSKFSFALSDYCKNSTLHGLKYLVEPNRPPLEKCVWLIILLTTLSISGFIFHLLIEDYLTKLTITTLENTKYPITKVPFPGIAICNINRISRKQVMKMTSDMYQKMNVSLDELLTLLTTFGKLYDFDLDKYMEIQKLQDIVERFSFEENSNDALVNILLQLSPTCNETLVKCMWNGIEQDCNEIFRTRRTNDGYCCTFNYVKSYQDYNYNHLDLRLSENENRESSREYYFTGAGIDSGLTIVVYSDPDDYYYPLISSEGFSVKLFNPHDYPDIHSGALIENYIPLKKEAFLQVGATTVRAVEALKHVPLFRRGCLFENEGKTVFDTSFYSYSDCLSDCKLKSILALCDCVPFFLPVLKSYAFSKQVCTVTDIPCLSQYRDKWRNIYPKLDIEELFYERDNSLWCPTCFPSCSFTTYSVEVDQAVLIDFPHKWQADNLNKHSVIHIYSNTEDTSMYLTDISYYWFDIIGNFGGTCSLFLGFSVISVVEFFYYMSVKYYNL